MKILENAKKYGDHVNFIDDNDVGLLGPSITRGG